MQNVSVLVASKAVLKPPQKMIPAMKPPIVKNPRLKYRLGVLNTVTCFFAHSIMASSRS
jgi:hypothetical protein